MTFYENLRIIREDRGFTQKQIADVLETTRQYYSDYENGKEIFLSEFTLHCPNFMEFQ